MPVGVPEDEVFAAADLVLARGERPTVERVRAEIGRGSPARVGTLLDAWWAALAQRLAGETRLPELPPPIADAFRRVWVAATEQAIELADAAVAEAQAAVAQDRAMLADQRHGWQTTLEIARAAETAAQQAVATRDAQLIDRQTLLDTQARTLTDLHAQRDALQARIATLEPALESSRQAQGAQAIQAREERAALQAHVRAVEDRAHAEVDQARQETKALRQQVKALERATADATRVQIKELAQTRSALAAAEQSATAQGARAEALTAQLASLGDLPAALRATLAQVRVTKRAPAPRKRATRSKA